MNVLELQDLVSVLNAKNMKDVLKLYNINFTSKDKKNNLQTLLIENKVNVNVIINYLGLDREAILVKINKYKKKQEKPTSITKES